MTIRDVLPHGSFEELRPGVWRLRGRMPFPLHRNMIVIRLRTGELLLHSVVAVDPPGLSALEALGRPAYAIVPSKSHQHDGPFYRARYPGITFLAPASIRGDIDPAIRIDDTVERVLPTLGFRLHAVPGVKAPEFVYEYELDAGGRMLMINDAFSNTDAHDGSEWMGRLLLRPLSVPGNAFGVQRVYRWRRVADIRALAVFARTLADTPDLRLVTVSHGEPILDRAAEILRGAIV